MVAPSRGFYGALAILLGILFLFGAAILVLNRGTFVYTLDDAYIHLALAENILRGHYGVNPGEFSAPSSSVLWAFLLAPFQATPLASLAPLLFNGILAAAALCILHAALRRAFEERLQGFAMTLALSLALLATNIVALVFTGMEHVLQITLAAAAILGLSIESREGRVPRWLPWVLVLGPLVRYENLVLSVPAIAYLLLRRRFGSAFSVAAGLILLLGAFSAWLIHLGLTPLPTSVLAKSVDVGPGVVRLDAIKRIHFAIAADGGSYLKVCLLLILARVFFPGSPRNRLLALAAATSVALHLALSFGKIGTYNRYEAYIWTFSLLALLELYRVPLRKALERVTQTPASRRLAAVLAVFLALVICDRIVVTTALLPAASNDIYRQQYQMRRFITESYRKPVAVNDLGNVSYRNDAYVLDLWGLASPEALKRRLTQTDPEWMDTLARAHDAKLVMIYDGWFPDGVPASWIRVGKLTRPARSHAGGRGVDFYVVDEAARADFTAKMRAFRATLPSNARFVFTDENAQPNVRPNIEPDAQQFVAVARGLYAAVQTLEMRGLPSDEAMKTLRPLLSLELDTLIETARHAQLHFIDAHPEDKPPWIEGNLFGSLFEGQQGYALGEARIQGDTARIPVRLEYHGDRTDTVRWTDEAIVVRYKEGWRVSDIRFNAPWAFKAGAGLRDVLKSPL